MTVIKRGKTKVMVAITSSDAMICDPLMDLCFPETHRGAGEGDARSSLLLKECTSQRLHGIP